MILIHFCKKIYRLVYKLFVPGIPVMLAVILAGCNKALDIPPPVNTTTTAEIFSKPSTAEAAIQAIYSDMNGGINQQPCFFSGGGTTYQGMSADELLNYGFTTSNQTNTLLPTDFTITPFWAPVYFDIYSANAAIEGLQASTTLPTATKNQLTGEAKFIRALCNFYLVNLFGDIPLPTTSNWTVTSLLPRTQVTQVFEQIIADLKDAQGLLITDYSVSNNDRIRANKWAATALLARAYLYTQDWANAAAQATLVINNPNYALVQDIVSYNVFGKNSTEAILQFPTINAPPYATLEANFILPIDVNSAPTFYLNPDLIAAFEANDQRLTAWTNTYVDPGGNTYYYPYKYKVREATSINTSTTAEWYTVLRLAEQYLIRAEAEANLGQLAPATADLNIIRRRAQLPDLSSSLIQTQVLAAVAQERRIELFSEMGHRWFDLKRTGQAHDVLSIVPYKQPWPGDYQLLYPIPYSELQADPNLTQNPGY